MPTFTYIGTTMDGKPERGTIETATAEEARETLRKRGVLVENVMRSAILTPQPVVAAPVAVPAEVPGYAPLSDTFRLYAGWLLAWYVIVYLLGSYQYTKRLPFEVPFVESLFMSPLVLNFAFGTFLFLMLSSVHCALGRGLWKGLLLAVVWAGLVTLFVVNA